MTLEREARRGLLRPVLRVRRTTLSWALPGGLVLHLLSGDRLPPIHAFGQLQHVFLPLALLFLPAALWQRRWVLAAALALTLAYSGATLGPRLLARAPPIRAPRDLRLVSFNMGNGRADVDQFLALVKELQPDVLALQEVREQRAVEVGLRPDYPHAVMHARGIEALALFSRFPLLEHDQLAEDARFPAMRVVLDVNGTPVRLLNVHVSAFVGVLGRWDRDAGLARRLAAEAMATPRQPALLVGDFNVTETGSDYRDITAAGLRDAYREVGAGLGFTFPVFRRWRGLPLPPFLRIDYVFHSAELEALSAAVTRSVYGDHLPLVVDLRLRTPD